MTSLDEITGHEEEVGARRPSGEAYSRKLRGKKLVGSRLKPRLRRWDPAVLVIGRVKTVWRRGAAHAARYRTLVVDKYPRSGQLACALPLIGAAQSDPRQSSALYAVSAELAEYIPKDMLELAGDVRRGDATQLLDRD